MLEYRREKESAMRLSNRTYDTLKWIALVALPAVQVFWLTIGKIWSIDYTIEIGATIGAAALLLGTLLGVSTNNYRAEKEQDNFNADDFEDMVEIDEEETDAAEE